MTTQTVSSELKIQSAEVSFTDDGATITVIATNAQHPRRLEHILERCTLKHASYSINNLNVDGATTTTVVVTYNDVKLTGIEPGDSARLSSLNDAMTRVVDAL